MLKARVQTAFEEHESFASACVGASAWLSEALLAKDPALLNDYETVAEEGVIRILRRRQTPSVR